MKTFILAITGLTMAGASLVAAPPPAHAQSVGYVTGLPGRDPAGDDEIGWGPAYRPETSYYQPGTPPTPGQIAGWAYRARTGRGVYDSIQGPVYGTSGYYPGQPALVQPPPVYRHRRVARQARHHHRTG